MYKQGVGNFKYFVGISSLTGQHWSDVCALLEIPELGEKMREVTLRGAEWQQFVAKAEPWLLARDANLLA